MKKPDTTPLRLGDLPLEEAHAGTLKAIARAAAASVHQLCLFVGPRGSGQILVAKVLAHEAERPLKRTKLSALFGKSIGETENNLKGILEKAQTDEAILFFDEADALFGKRSSVKDDDDRYANQEVNHFLDAVGSYRGLVILCSNLKVEDDSPLSGRSAHVLTFSQKPL